MQVNSYFFFGQLVLFSLESLVWDTIFKGLVTTVQVRCLLEICCHGYAVKTLYNEAYAKFDSP